MRKALNHPEFGIPWDRGNLTDLDFADDVALLSHSATTLQQMTDSLKTSAEMVGLQISSDKTKVSTVSATDTPISIGQQTLEGVSEFQYLVSIISTNSDVDVDIRAKIGKAASTFQRLCKIWSSHSINLDTKLRLYMSIVIPTALHACETWKSTSIIRQKLHVFYQRCLRTILGISWRDHITNDEVCEKLISEAYLRLCNKGGWDLWAISYVCQKTHQHIWPWTGNLVDNIQWGPTWYGTYLDGCKEICQRHTEMEKARRPLFQQELEELRSKVR